MFLEWIAFRRSALYFAILSMSLERYKSAAPADVAPLLLLLAELGDDEDVTTEGGIKFSFRALLLLLLLD